MTGIRIRGLHGGGWSENIFPLDVKFLCFGVVGNFSLRIIQNEVTILPRFEHVVALLHEPTFGSSVAGNFECGLRHYNLISLQLDKL